VTISGHPLADFHKTSFLELLMHKTLNVEKMFTKEQRFTFEQSDLPTTAVKMDIMNYLIKLRLDGIEEPYKPMTYSSGHLVLYKNYSIQHIRE
jgi:hypothetical protein